MANNQLITINFVEETIRVNIQGGMTYTYAPSGDMLKSVYDIDNDGKVDLANDSEKLGGYDANEYQLISDMPTIPTALSQLTKDINFDERYYTETETNSLLDNKVTKNPNIVGNTFTKITYDSKGLVTSGSNILASDLPAGIDATKIGTGLISNTEFGYLNNVSSNIQTQISSKQATLISGTNIKTINGNSILGSGNLSVSGGDVSNLVPYTGATQNVNLGTFELTTDGIQLDLINDTVAGQGKLYWNADDLTANLGLSDNVNLQIGQEYVYRVKADSNIANGQPVFATGSTGNSGRINVDKQTADSSKDSKYFLGLATESLVATEEGFVTAFGLVRDILISDVQQSGESWVVGDVLYVSATESGKLTKTKPAAPNLHISTAMVLFVNGAETQCTLFVRPLQGLKINDIHDVYTNGKSNNDVLIWNNTNQRWENSALKTINTLSLFGSGNINLNDTYYTETEVNSLLSGKSDTSHNHTLASLTEKSYNSLTDKPTIPTLPINISDVINLQTTLDGKVDENVAITGATKTKITYDAKGLVTGGADATTADIADSLNKRYVTDANLTVIGNTSGTNTGDETQSTIKTKLGAATTSVDGYLTSTDWNTFNGKQASLGYTAENVTNKENTTIDTSTTKYPTVNLLKNGLDLKVDKVVGKQLSTEDYTTTEKNKLAGIEAGAEVNVNADWNSSSGDSQILNKPTLFSGSYTDLTDKPTIPSTTFYTQTNLTIDGANGNYFLVSLNANASFSLSNITTGTQYYFRIKNTSAGTITITLPNTADIKAAATFTVGASNKYKEVAMIYDGTNRTWQISEELT